MASFKWSCSLPYHYRCIGHRVDNVLNKCEMCTGVALLSNLGPTCPTFKRHFPLEKCTARAAKMERLLAREESNQPWSLRYDRDLLEVLSDLSGDMLDRMQSQESDLADLETATSSTSARLGNAAASFGGLCHSQFIEQVGRTSGSSCGVCLVATLNFHHHTCRHAFHAALVSNPPGCHIMFPCLQCRKWHPFLPRRSAGHSAAMSP